MPRSSTARRASTRTARKDAISLLKADHRQVEKWFGEFEKARADSRKTQLAAQICLALRVHTQIEEEILYPAFFEATEDTELHHEAIVEHDGAKRLIEQIEASGPDEEFFDAKVKVLSEMIKHHVKEEEQPGGMFAEAKKAKMDLKELGEQLAARKAELMGESSANGRKRTQRGTHANA
ncbi:hemerythrin superfamily protein [Povalibacter uvarum]|uniref:Hemerythrin superfamily protein n=1 Tax=Povalibacter uvarum TaxID=732238 RepID=A0A841HTT8_9GAMM|nr:hemerythrin domain-containing protein [Povalibacter uvarum]MBB6096044.1 hemerythrin superfamily protein [Povalibacter uvarum]